MIFDAKDLPERIVLPRVSWSYYERTLEQIGNQPIRVAFLDGMMELMELPPEHEIPSNRIGMLVTFLVMERGIPTKSFGATTFRCEEKAVGGEPDESFYFFEIDSVKGMERFDPAIHRAPDLWIEGNMFPPRVLHEPIHARLGVPEVWLYNGDELTVRLLTTRGVYADSPASRAFPFLPLDGFANFIPKMIEGDETQALLEFREWARSLPR